MSSLHPATSLEDGSVLAAAAREIDREGMVYTLRGEEEVRRAFCFDVDSKRKNVTIPVPRGFSFESKPLTG